MDNNQRQGTLKPLSPNKPLHHNNELQMQNVQQPYISSSKFEERRERGRGEQGGRGCNFLKKFHLHDCVIENTSKGNHKVEYISTSM